MTHVMLHVMLHMIVVVIFTKLQERSEIQGLFCLHYDAHGLLYGNLGFPVFTLIPEYSVLLFACANIHVYRLYSAE